MKKLLIIFSFASVFVANAYAQKTVTEKDGWSAIRVNRKVQIVQPQFAQAFGPDGLFNICVDVDEFKSIHPVNICTTHKVIEKSTLNTEEDSPAKIACVEKTFDDVTISRKVTKAVCLNRTEATETEESECTEWGEESYMYPREYNLDVVYLNKQEAQNVLFKKKVELPNCN